MRWFLQFFAACLTPEVKRFYQALSNPKIAQEQVQRDIYDRLLASEYGQSLGIRSLADWADIPVVEYEDLQPWIDRQRQSQQVLLTPEPILFYEKTSGSRGPAKLIPYTKSLQRSYNHLFCIWAQDLLLQGPGFSTGKTYFCISPQLDSASQTDEVGLEDDSEYLDRWLRLLLRPFLISPPGLNRLRDPEQFKQQLCLALLRESRLETISIWSPSFLKVLLDYIQTHAQQLHTELKAQIPQQRSRLDRLLDSEIPWTQIWPELKLISCWDSVHAADPARSLQILFPGVMVQGKGLLATEAPVTVPLIPAQGYLPLLDEVFFEFEDEAQKIFHLHEIQVGQIYSLILSQKGGLYRYRLGDRVRVSHFYHQTPCLEFMGRSAVVSDLVGEKLHEDFVRQALDSLGLAGTFYRSLLPMLHPVPHYLLLLDRASLPPDLIAAQLDQALSQAYHYHHARLLGQLGSAQVVISEKIPETMSQIRMQSGQKWGDLKHPLLGTVAMTQEFSNLF